MNIALHEATELDVLIIEDNPADLFLIEFYLEESLSPRFRTFRAGTIREAKELLHSRQFDMILLDLNLPDSLGVKTISNLLEHFPDNLIIVLTGITSEKTGLESVRHGAQDFLVKGRFDSKVLHSSLRFSYERFHLNKEISQSRQDIRQFADRMQEIMNTQKISYYEFEQDKCTFKSECQQAEAIDINQLQSILNKTSNYPYSESIKISSEKLVSVEIWKRLSVFCVLIKYMT